MVSNCDFCHHCEFVHRQLTIFFSCFHQDDGYEETAIGVYWVTDGLDRCLVGFLPRHCIRHRRHYNGRAAQVVEFYARSESPTERHRSYKNCGVCMAAMLEMRRI